MPLLDPPSCWLWWPQFNKEKTFAKKMAKKLANRK